MIMLAAWRVPANARLGLAPALAGDPARPPTAS